MKKFTVVIVALLMVLSVCLVAGCDKIADNTEHYDKITKTLKLTANYTGKKFYEDGYAKVRVASYTDGDTTLFYSETDGATINVRYYSVNTPESTGGVEKWGKAASNFTKSRLSEATEIVIESSTGSAPQKDSYGTRWLGYVWYKTATDDFKLLNLELVENGFSENTGMNTNAYKYNSYFESANQFARKIKLRLYSELDDPLFNNDPVPMTIKEFNENPEAFYDIETEAGSKVIFYAYLTKLSVSGSWHTFTAAQYDPDTNQVYEINVYTGSSSASGSSMKIGDYYKIVGSIAKHSSTGYQVSGIVYSTTYDSPETSFLEQANYYLTFNSGTTYIDQLNKNLYSDVTVTAVQAVSGGKLTFTATAFKRSKDGQASEATTFTFSVKVPDNYSGAIAVGKKLALTGLQLVKNSGEILVINYSDIIQK